MLWRGDHLVTSSTGSAGDNASSFAAENHALHLALNGIQQCHVSTDIVRIVTDSLSNVVMLAKGPISQTTPQGMLLWQRLIDIASHVRRIDIAFVFGHCGLPRGDTVDLEAKRAVAITSSPPPISFKEMLMSNNENGVLSVKVPGGVETSRRPTPPRTAPSGGGHGGCSSSIIKATSTVTRAVSNSAQKQQQQQQQQQKLSNLSVSLRPLDRPTTTATTTKSRSSIS
eukprot:PhM_4_TR2075/c4_g2_i3/m.6999